MKQLQVTTSTIVKLGDTDVVEVIDRAASLAHEVLEELSIYRQENDLDSDIFACEGTCCEFLDLIGD